MSLLAKMRDTADGRSAIEIIVAGNPAPGGSKNAFLHKTTGRLVVTDAGGARTKLWRKAVTEAAISQYEGEPLEGPLWVEVYLYMPRPLGHYGTGKNAGVLKANAPVYHLKAPDATKLWRSTEDSLTGVVWKDDAQVADQKVRKAYVGPLQKPGAKILIGRIT